MRTILSLGIFYVTCVIWLVSARAVVAATPDYEQDKTSSVSMSSVSTLSVNPDNSVSAEPLPIDPSQPPILLDPALTMKTEQATIHSFSFDEHWSAVVKTDSATYTIDIPDSILDDVSVGDVLYVTTVANRVASFAGLDAKT